MIKLLKSMGKKIFDGDFHEAIVQKYNEVFAHSAYAIAEKEYTIAKPTLMEIFSAKEQKLLEETESLFSENRNYVAEYAYQAGVFCGFYEFFNKDDQLDDGGFDQYVFHELFERPRIQAHKCYDCLTRCNEIETILSNNVQPEISDHLTSIGVAWENRAYYAALYGFYMGYRSALMIVERINPLFKVGNSKRMLLLGLALDIEGKKRKDSN